MKIFVFAILFTLFALLVFIFVLLKIIKALYKLAYYDFLTGVYNRRYLAGYMQRLAEKSEAVCCVMLDVNNFKQINDTLGHCIGDKVLKEIAAILQKAIASSDMRGFVARYGGDEFYMVLHTKNKFLVKPVINKIKLAFEQFYFFASMPHKISCSVGYDIYDPAKWSSFDMFERHIDKLMYKHKGTKLFMP
jgi:diguanylate cyclase (GGDEF)-like protein